MKRIIILAAFITVLSGCFKDPECTYDECGKKAPATEIQNVQTYLTNNNITATQHCSGMFYVIQQQGTGAYPTGCGGATVYYKGMLTDGSIFDETTAGQPAGFNMSGLIPGFKNGLLQLKSGGKMTIYIPPSLGYGNTQAGSIPPNSILIFEVELLSAQ